MKNRYIGEVAYAKSDRRRTFNPKMSHLNKVRMIVCNKTRSKLKYMDLIMLIHAVTLLRTHQKRKYSQIKCDIKYTTIDPVYIDPV